MAGFLSGIFGAHRPDPAPEDQAALAAARRPGVVLEIGGKPKPDTRQTSWWGGNFIAEPPRAGLVPLVQIRTDELPPALSERVRANYLLIWIEADPAERIGPTLGLEIQRLPAPSPATLAPVETICRLGGALACLPLSPARQQPIMMLPHPDDAPISLPKTKPLPAPEDEEPVTFGGWPMWIGPSRWPEGMFFAMEIRSSQKGRLMLPENGSLYLFEAEGGGWQVQADGF